MTFQEFVKREKQLRNPDPLWWLPWLVVAGIVVVAVLFAKGF